MDMHRVAQLLRELADEIDEAPEEKPSEPRKRRPKERVYPAPLHPVSDVDRMRAKKMLRKMGIHR